MLRKSGILGYPLGHSISPYFQNAAFGFLGIEASYQAWATKPEDLSDKVNALRSTSFMGANVTIPYKEAVIELLDEIDDWAEKVGSVNTVVNDSGTLVGYNTDTVGFIQAISEYGNYDPSGEAVLLIGAGGAARAAAYALVGNKVGSLVIANRTYQRAEKLASEFSAKDKVSPVLLNSPGFLKAVDSASLIVNSTAIGMKHTSVENSNPLEGINVKAGVLVNDMVYNPLKTPMLVHAAETGAKILTGLPMLVLQGAASFNLWTGKEAPVDVMILAAQEALSD
ncbi:MAG: shikimate dehydrogenase [Chloroflexi bacterium]|jgi:shikimate dehydrogenase|nr:MAG: shikimate dehydrogenase [Chloroflexota bacterium]